MFATDNAVRGSAAKLLNNVLSKRHLLGAMGSCSMMALEDGARVSGRTDSGNTARLIGDELRMTFDVAACEVLGFNIFQDSVVINVIALNPRRQHGLAQREPPQLGSTFPHA